MLPGGDGPVVAACHDQVTGAGDGAVPQPGLSAGVDGAVVEEVVADPAGQLAGLPLGPGQQQRVLPREVVGEPAAARQVHRLPASPPRSRPCSSYTARTEASPARSRNVASRSQSWRNRTGSASCT